MTPTLPRPIEPGEPLRKGWRVRAQRTMHGTVSATYEFTVDYEVRVGERVYAKDSGPHGMSFDRPDYTWTLLAEAPTPAPAVGSRWHSRERHTSYVYHRDDFYAPYNGESRRALLPNDGTDAAIIANLTPIPDHGDGCSEWLWDETTQTAWVARIRPDRASVYVQVAGELTHGGVISLAYDDEDSAIVGRLVSWSERGQANG